MAEDTAQVGLTGILGVVWCVFRLCLDVGGVTVDLLLICDVVHLQKTLWSRPLAVWFLNLNVPSCNWISHNSFISWKTVVINTGQQQYNLSLLDKPFKPSAFVQTFDPFDGWKVRCNCYLTNSNWPWYVTMNWNNVVRKNYEQRY